MVISWTYVVIKNYGRTTGFYREPLHLVRAPNGQGHVLTRQQLKEFLAGKKWRYAR